MAKRQSEWKNKCKVCKQFTADVINYEEIPDCLLDEKEVLAANKQLSSFVDHGKVEGTYVPSVKLTSFAVYDKNNHFCPFDTGLLEKGVALYFSGYVKAFDDEDSSINNGIFIQDAGPIKEWWIYGFDGGEKSVIGLSTKYALYHLMEPLSSYKDILKNLNQKSRLSKTVIEFLLDFGYQNPTFEEFMQHLKNFDIPGIEELLFREAQFICNQIINYDDDSSDEEPMISLLCIQTLISLTGVTVAEKSSTETILKGTKKQNISHPQVVSTRLVREVFEKCFCDQPNDKSVNKSNNRRMSYEHVNGFQIQDSSSKHEESSDSATSENQECHSELGNKPVKHKECSKLIIHNVEWLKKNSAKYNGCQGYSSATINNFIVQQGDYIMLHAEEPNEPLRIAKVSYMYDSRADGPMFHAHFFCRGTDTILGNTANPRELFVVDDCDDCPLGCIVQKTEVHFKKTPKNWADLGNNMDLLLDLEDNGKNYYFSKIYDYEFSRFIDYVEDASEDFKEPCISCKWQKKIKRDEIPAYEGDCIKWRNDIFTIGTAVFLEPGKSKNICESTTQDKNVMDDKLHTEIYRKNFDINKGSNLDTPEPFTVGLIEDIKQQKHDIKVKIRMFYRPEDTCQSHFLAYVTGINYLFWTNNVIWTTFKYVAGKCYVTYSDDEHQAREWCEKGPFRFYYTKAYNYKSDNIYDVPLNGKKICCELVNDDYMPITRSNSKNMKLNFIQNSSPPVWPEINKPLKCMDIYAGCGGLTEGLHQSGIAETLWAIEKEPAPAQAYQMNNPHCKVFTEDCNDVLEALLNNKTDNCAYPAKGDVELLIGGPPCQGYSGMNRFSSGQDSYFKNSQIITFLSYCDFYRPKYFIFENVRNFVSFKKCEVFKRTLKCLLAIGYQISFGILQAGNFGIPQTRRRFIMMGAAPGYILPNFPEPLHVFSRSGTLLSILVDGLRYDTGSCWSESLPYRTICVRDAIADLPDIENGATTSEVPYDEEPQSHFQKYMRKSNNDLVEDHICKEMASIVEARMSHIPTYPGADWRDLPNKTVQLKDGKFTKVLKYPYRKNNQQKYEPPRGVCKCALGRKCDPSDRQSNTLIPWFLAHTADRHNNWVSVYGRLEWDGFFGTTITNPEPTGTQGRVLHPEQNRVVSVRECARSQGFPDHYKFYGNILDKHRQIGNAVPPPLALALGREIIKACNTSRI